MKISTLAVKLLIYLVKTLSFQHYTQFTHHRCRPRFNFLVSRGEAEGVFHSVEEGFCGGLVVGTIIVCFLFITNMGFSLYKCDFGGG